MALIHWRADQDGDFANSGNWSGGRTPGVGDAQLFGPQNYAMRVWLQTDRLTGLGLAAVLHGGYDRTAGHWPSVFIAAIAILLFAGYTKTTDDIGALIGHVHGPGIGSGDDRAVPWDPQLHPISTPSPPWG